MILEYFSVGGIFLDRWYLSCSFSNNALYTILSLVGLGKYTAILAILVVGSFIVPMAQYFWYVRDDDSSDRFFAQDIPDPEPPKKKGFW